MTNAHVNSTKKATNLFVSKALLERAKKRNINLSGLFEKSLIAELKRAEEAEWLQDNAKGIEEYNQLIDERGVFSDGLRRF